jgi:hypothetical protein
MEQPKSPPYVLRPARESDIESIVDLVVDAMATSPQWGYRAPYSRQYPEVHRAETAKRFHQALYDVAHGTWVLTVAEALPEGLNEEDRAAGAKNVIVGFFLYQLPGTIVEPHTRLLKIPDIVG